MGGRGASSGISVSGKVYGSEYHSILKDGNIKFVVANEGSVTAPMETMIKRRVYVTVDEKKNKIKHITYYDNENKRVKQIDYTLHIMEWIHIHIMVIGIMKMIVKKVQEIRQEMKRE